MMNTAIATSQSLQTLVYRDIWYPGPAKSEQDDAPVYQHQGGSDPRTDARTYITGHTERHYYGTVGELYPKIVEDMTPIMRIEAALFGLEALLLPATIASLASLGRGAIPVLRGMIKTTRDKAQRQLLQTALNSVLHSISPTSDVRIIKKTLTSVAKTAVKRSLKGRIDDYGADIMKLKTGTIGSLVDDVAGGVKAIKRKAFDILYNPEYAQPKAAMAKRTGYSVGVPRLSKVVPRITPTDITLAGKAVPPRRMPVHELDRILDQAKFLNITGRVSTGPADFDAVLGRAIHVAGALKYGTTAKAAARRLLTKGKSSVDDQLTKVYARTSVRWYNYIDPTGQGREELISQALEYAGRKVGPAIALAVEETVRRSLPDDVIDVINTARKIKNVYDDIGDVIDLIVSRKPSSSETTADAPVDDEDVVEEEAVREVSEEEAIAGEEDERIMSDDQADEEDVVDVSDEESGEPPRVEEFAPVDEVWTGTLINSVIAVAEPDHDDVQDSTDHETPRVQDGTSWMRNCINRPKPGETLEETTQRCLLLASKLETQGKIQLIRKEGE
jgi:hypothetical protein